MGCNADSRLTNRWSAAKGHTSYGYDGVGNLLTVAYPVSHSLSYAYDALNRATNMVDGVGTTSYSYTIGGLLASEVGPWANSTVTYSYNNARLRSSLVLTQPRGNPWTNSYTWDAADRLLGVVSPAGTFAYSYAGAGRLLDRVTLPSSAYLNLTYDAVARQTASQLVNSGNTVLESEGYAYNTAGQRTTVYRPDSSYDTVGYDPDGQVLSAVGSGGQSSESLGYLYDGAWNLNAVTNHSSVTAYSVNSQNELTSVAGNSCSYDANGNLTGFSQGGYTYACTYDDENELATITSYYGGSNYQLSEMSYDGRGRLRVRQDYTWEYGGWYPVASIDYVYDGPEVIQERNYGTPTTYTRGWDLSGSFTGAGGIGGLLARTTGNSVNGYTSAYYHADGNGNVVSLSDGTQTVVASYRYDPFGNTMAATGTLAAANTYRFSSKDVNPNFGLYYYGYRWYAPGLQRWVNRDPSGEWQSINLYGFAFNTPASEIDPNGLWIEDDDGFPILSRYGSPLDAYRYDRETKRQHDQIMCEAKQTLKKAASDLLNAALLVSTDGLGELGALGDLAYGEHVLQTIASNDLHHSFPSLVDPIVLQYGRKTVVSDQYWLYELAGSINGTPGLYQIGVDPINWLITHRFFHTIL